MEKNNYVDESLIKNEEDKLVKRDNYKTPSKRKVAQIYDMSEFDEYYRAVPDKFDIKHLDSYIKHFDQALYENSSDHVLFRDSYRHIEEILQESCES